MEWVEFIVFVRMIATHVGKKITNLSEILGKDATEWRGEDLPY